MALSNFSMPYQPVTALPFFYPGSHPVNSLRLNAVLPASSEPEYDEEESLRHSPYAVQYQQQRQQQRQNNQYSAQSSFSYASRNSQGLARNYDRGQNQRTNTHEESKIVKLSSGPLQSNVHSREEQPPRFEPQQDTFQDNYPGRPTGYTKVNTGFTGSGAKTSLHAILDYDDDDENTEDYYDEDPKVPFDTNVTPIQGPIFLKDGKVPVVPLYSYPRTNNGSLVQIPLLWTALSVALGVELKGDIVKGIPCIKKNHQLYCPTAGNSYPIERIENFIDENKALIKRMYGEFEMGSDQNPLTRRRRKATTHDIPDGGPSLPVPDGHVGESFFSHLRKKRQDTKNFNTNAETGRMDICESKIEIITPYWSRNSAGKLRAVVNTQHFEQAIHQEVCTKPRTGRCSGDCGCEQKYKWHRLLAYDPDNDCKGIFMDWFLFPSCCVCRCDPADKKSEKSDQN